MLVPFSLRINPVQRLLLLSFGGNDAYTGLEVQRFDDPRTGSGLAVLVTRKDGRAEVYWEPGLRLNREHYTINEGLASWQSAAMSRSRFDLTSRGVQLDLQLQLADGRELQLAITESSKRQPRRFTLLAPAGHAMKDPGFFPLFWMNDFSFVSARRRRIGLTIGGDRRRPVRIGVPWRLPRYGAAPVTAVWNARHDGAVPVVEARGAGSYDIDGTTMDLVEHEHVLGIAAIRATNGERRLAVVHVPPVPDLASLPDGYAYSGTVSVTVDDVDQFGGSYTIRRRGSEVVLEMDVDRPWQPHDPRRTVRMLFGALRFFRTWPTTYRWRAAIDLARSPATMRSGWSRKRR